MRKFKKTIKIGSLYIGGSNPIRLQSMTNTKTKDIHKTVSQILELEKIGCEIIRVAVTDIEDAIAIKEIKNQIHIPIVADIHFDHNLAIESIKSGADKIRINPGNIGADDKVKLVANACKAALDAADAVTVSNEEHAVARVIYDLEAGKYQL